MRRQHNYGPEVQIFLNLLQAEDMLVSDFAALLKQHAISPPQYNVLRILRGAMPDGLRCQEIASRMITRVPDITRLLDRLEKARLVQRRRNDEDRRVVVTKLRKNGLRLLEELDQPVLDLHRSHLARFERSEIKELDRLLCKLIER